MKINRLQSFELIVFDIEKMKAFSNIKYFVF